MITNNNHFHQQDLGSFGYRGFSLEPGVKLRNTPSFIIIAKAMALSYFAHRATSPLSAPLTHTRGEGSPPATPRRGIHVCRGYYHQALTTIISLPDDRRSRPMYIA